MVRPSLENRGTVWDPYKQNHIKAIEQVQRRAVRFVFNDNGMRHKHAFRPQPKTQPAVHDVQDLQQSCRRQRRQDYT
mgnify:CR=1 FL=1